MVNRTLAIPDLPNALRLAKTYALSGTLQTYATQTRL